MCIAPCLLLYCLTVLLQETKKAQDVQLQEHKKPIAINKLYTDSEFDNPPYALTSSVVKCMDPNRRTRCVMATMS